MQKAFSFLNDAMEAYMCWGVVSF